MKYLTATVVSLLVVMTGLLFSDFSLNRAGNGYDCSSLVIVDKKYFNQHSLTGSVLDTSNLPVVNARLHIQLGKRNLIFENDRGGNVDSGELTHYSYAGTDKKRNWILVKKQNWKNDYYYLINTRTEVIDTLIGYPHIYANRMICFEGPETDGTNYIEIWEIEKDSLELKSKFSLNNCDIYPWSIGLSDLNELLIKAADNYYKTKI